MKKDEEFPVERKEPNGKEFPVERKEPNGKEFPVERKEPNGKEPNGISHVQRNKIRYSDSLFPLVKNPEKAQDAEELDAAIRWLSRFINDIKQYHFYYRQRLPYLFYVEIGSGEGLSMLAFGQFFDECLSIDIPGTTWGIEGTNGTERSELWLRELTGIPVTSILGDSQSKETIEDAKHFIKNAIQIKNCITPLLFIDADHSYEGVTNDWNNYIQVFSPKAVMLHDISDSENHRNQNVGVPRFWKEKRERNGEEEGIITVKEIISNNKFGGIGIIEFLTEVLKHEPS